MGLIRGHAAKQTAQLIEKTHLLSSERKMRKNK
jgi:hypothetical protein